MSRNNESGTQGIIAEELQDRKMKNWLRMQFAAQFVFLQHDGRENIALTLKIFLINPGF
jgi:hypothetical protein